MSYFEHNNSSQYFNTDNDKLTFFNETKIKSSKIVNNYPFVGMKVSTAENQTNLAYAIALNIKKYTWDETKKNSMEVWGEDWLQILHSHIFNVVPVNRNG
jgi:hypothetical protein